MFSEHGGGDRRLCLPFVRALFPPLAARRLRGHFRLEWGSWVVTTPPSCPTAFNPQTEQLKGFFKINPNHKDPSKPRPLSSSDLGSFNSITPPPFTFPSDIRQPEVDSAGFPPGLQTSEPQRRKAEGRPGGWRRRVDASAVQEGGGHQCLSWVG